MISLTLIPITYAYGAPLEIHQDFTFPVGNGHSFNGGILGSGIFCGHDYSMEVIQSVTITPGPITVSSQVLHKDGDVLFYYPLYSGPIVSVAEGYCTPGYPQDYASVICHQTGIATVTIRAGPRLTGDPTIVLTANITCGIAEPLEIKKIVTLDQNGFSADEQITLIKQAKLVEATLVEPDKSTIHSYLDIPKDLPTSVAFSDPNWSPGVQLKDGKWELKLQIIALYEDAKTQELKNVEQKIIIQFDVMNNLVSVPQGRNSIDLNKDIIIGPHPAQLNGRIDFQIGENITGETKVLVSEVSLLKPLGDVVSYTKLPIDISTTPAKITLPDTGWVSSDGKPVLDQNGMWQANIEIIGFYQDGTLAIKKVNQKLWIDFNVIPETMIGTLGLLASAGVGLAYFTLRKHQRI